MKNFTTLAKLGVVLICASLLSACASHHHHAKKAPASATAKHKAKAKANIPAVAAAPAAPAPAPAPAAPPTKEQRLAALLVQYQTDKISPEEYHTQRAAIIAEP